MVSIIIPMYNAEDTIERCLYSVKNQTYEDWEAIIIDDASIDKCVEICKKITKDDARFHIHQMKENKGPAAARNYGLSVCKGDWVSFVDSDDEIGSDFLLREVEVANEEHAQIVMCGLVNIKDGKPEDYYRTFCGEKRAFGREEMGRVVTPLYTVKGEDGSNCLNLRGPYAKLFNVKLAKSKKFPEEVDLGEDICYVRQVCDDCDKFVYFNEILYFRHVRDNSISHNIIPRGNNEGWRRAYGTNYLIEYNEKHAKIKVDVNYNQIMYNFLTSTACTNVHVVPKMPLRDSRRLVHQCKESLIYKIDFTDVKDRLSIMVKCIEREWYYMYKLLFVLCNILTINK